MRDNPLERLLFDDLPEGNAGPALASPSPPADEPAEWSDDFDLIVELVGTKAAFRIAEAFAGSSVYIPKTIMKHKEYHEIRGRHRAGATYKELSGKYGYTETHIRNIVHTKKLTGGKK